MCVNDEHQNRLIRLDIWVVMSYEGDNLFRFKNIKFCQNTRDYESHFKALLVFRHTRIQIYLMNKNIPVLTPTLSLYDYWLFHKFKETKGR